MTDGRTALPEAPTAGGESDRLLLDRFVRHQDEKAFAALVGRHGPMVLAVCRRILGNVQDAEDAFQATFLVLVRRAHSLREPALLGNWLYGVACRTARKARAQAARRQQMERQAAAMPVDEPGTDDKGRELRALLDEELQTLPPKYRAPLVLCYLEGLTNEEAARRLGWPTGSISYRLARGRELLRERMRRHDFVLPAGLFALFLAREAGPASVPAALAAEITQAARFALVHASLTGGGITAPVRELTETILRTLAGSRRRRALLAFVAVVLSSLGLATAGYAAFGDGLGSAPDLGLPGATSVTPASASGSVGCSH
ncbi:MAG TPA: sigma-70 family RNA polymerase sigma factor [Gemmataceae bacterium]|nr:sigma-70 family RNA polymerase sigma factor [Gemmataceae bacterium]